jgi:hypothetical protein
MEVESGSDINRLEVAVGAVLSESVSGFCLGNRE